MKAANQKIAMSTIRANPADKESILNSNHFSTRQLKKEAPSLRAGAQCPRKDFVT
jgi:hypothetical protein